MLRISYSLNSSRQQWTLCGQLTGPWVQELRSCWELKRAPAAASRSVVDLSDVTFIDEAGEALLSEMRKASVEFIAAGVETKDLLENLTNGERALRRLAAPLSDRANPHRHNPCGEPRLTENTTRRDK
jgi:hypothetical protein